MRIGFIGAGNMGGAILKGYAPVAAEKGDIIYVYNRTEATRKALEAQFDTVKACSSAEELVRNIDVIMLGIKPYGFEDFLPSIADLCTKQQIIVSMAAGIKIDYI